MSSPPPDNILLDPISELERALRDHSFGLDSLSHVIVDASFPRTAGEREDVASEARAMKNTPERVVGRAKLVLLNNEGSAEVVLDQRGYSVSLSPSLSVSVVGLPCAHTLPSTLDRWMIHARLR